MTSETPPAVDGFSEWPLEDWEDFIKLFSDQIFDKKLLGILANHRDYVYRGQRDPSWELTSSVNRLLSGKNRRDIESFGGRWEIKSDSSGSNAVVQTGFIQEHLVRFEQSIRGKTNISALQPLPPDERDLELWAIGQHHGLGTPLLDWTTPPFVAAFFAFEEKVEEKEKGNDKMRVVYALDKKLIEDKLVKNKPTNKPIRFFMPKLGENPRLLAQGGLFTEIPIGMDLEYWVKENFKDSNDHVLIKIFIPSNNRHGFLKLLNRFNINHHTLYPDLIGASKYCNLNFEIDDY